MKYLVNISFFFLYALSLPAQVNDDNWPVFRGRHDLSGSIRSELPESPSLLWNLATGSRTKSSPVISEDVIYFGTDKGTLYAVGTDGKIRWNYETGSAIEAPPLVFGNIVYAGSSDGSMRAVNKSTGKLLWTYTTDNQIVGSANVWTAGKLSGIIFGSYDYYLHCVDPLNGKALWKLETMNYVNGTPAVSNNRILFGGCDGIMRVVDPRSGVERDTFNIGVYIAASPAVVSDKAFFGDYNGGFYCLDIINRKILWKIAPGGTAGSILGIPASAGNYVVIGNEDKHLYCYNTQDGRSMWKFRTNGRVVGSAVVTPSKVLAGSMDGYVYLLGLTGGKKLWSFNTGAPVSSSPAVSKGRFFILTEEGRLLAFGTK
jgi:outer membrane protein assembly factor BamB